MKTSFFILAMLCVFYAHSQQVIAGSGNHFENETVQMSWTLGEPVIETLFNQNIQLTQGFHQTLLFVTAIEDFGFDMSISAYPNPTSDFLNLVIKNDEVQDLYYVIYSMQGKKLSKNQVESEMSEISMGSYSPGTYLLVISNGEQKLKTFKIIKK